MMRFLNSSTSPIGIDVGSNSIEAVQLRRAGNSWRLASVASLPRTDPSVEVNAEDLTRLNSVLFRQGFKSRQVVTAVPKEKLLASLIELPPKGAAVPLDQIARMELAR